MGRDESFAGPLYSLSASELAELIRSQEVSATDVVNAHIDRIEEVDRELNAVVVPLFSEARAAAVPAWMP